MSVASAHDLLAGLDGIARIQGTRLLIDDESRLRGEAMDGLVEDAVFNADEAVRDAARWLIWSASQALGCGSASIHELYMARGRGEFAATRFTVPAINVRAVTYLTARQAFSAAMERDAGAVILEIAKSEMAYTDQRPAEYAAVILGAAIRSGWVGPVFLQGDHFQFNAAKWAADPGAEMSGLKQLTSEAVAAGFCNIDIDSSTLVDLSQPTAAAEQLVNVANTVELTALIRAIEPDGVTISIGGEIGEVGKSNSTEEELRAYLDGYFGMLHGTGMPAISKVSIQT
ncbi:MAG TPA: class II fructose-bisphosphate aldolase, partial [Candidatus Limnocylindria bacterium]